MVSVGGYQMADVITKAELGRRLGLSRARVSQLRKLGLPIRDDGKVDREQALAWMAENVDPWRGGWGKGLRQKQAGRRRTPMTAASTESDTEVEGLSGFGDFLDFGDLPKIEIPDWEGEIRERAVIEFINDVRQTTHIANFARMAL